MHYPTAYCAPDWACWRASHPDYSGRMCGTGTRQQDDVRGVKPLLNDCDLLSHKLMYPDHRVLVAPIRVPILSASPSSNCSVPATRGSSSGTRAASAQQWSEREGSRRQRRSLRAAGSPLSPKDSLRPTIPQIVLRGRLVSRPLSAWAPTTPPPTKGTALCHGLRLRPGQGRGVSWDCSVGPEAGPT